MVKAYEDVFPFKMKSTNGNYALLFDVSDKIDLVVPCCNDDNLSYDFLDENIESGASTSGHQVNDIHAV